MKGQRNPTSSFTNLPWIIFLLSLTSLKCQAYFSGIAHISRNHQLKLDDKNPESYVSSSEGRDETINSDNYLNPDVSKKEEKRNQINELSTRAMAIVKVRRVGFKIVPVI